MSSAETTNEFTTESTITDSETFWNSKLFLGREFLLWLWHYIDEKNGSLDVTVKNKKVNCKLWIEDKIVLESQRGHVHKQSLRGASPAKSHEAGIALNTGKLPTEFRLVLEVPNIGPISAVVHSLKTGFNGVMLPQADQAKDAQQDENRVATRIEQLGLFEKAYETLVTIFLSERTSNSWKDKISPQISSWIKNRASSISSEALLH